MEALHPKYLSFQFWRVRRVFISDSVRSIELGGCTTQTDSYGLGWGWYRVMPF